MSFKLSTVINISYSHRILADPTNESMIHGHNAKVMAVCSCIDANHTFTSVKLKYLMNKYVYQILDHKFIIYNKDEQLLKLFFKNYVPQHYEKYLGTIFVKLVTPDGFEVVIVSENTTAKNFAKLIFDQLKEEVYLASGESVKLEKIVFLENASDSAIYQES